MRTCLGDPHLSYEVEGFVDSLGSKQLSEDADDTRVANDGLSLDAEDGITDIGGQFVQDKLSSPDIDDLQMPLSSLGVPVENHEVRDAPTLPEEITDTVMPLHSEMPSRI